MLSEIVLIVFYLIILIYSVILHEISHGLIALWLGDTTAKYAGRLNLNPRHHVDPLGSVLVPLFMIFVFQFAFGWARPVPYNPYNLRDQKWGPLFVALAGPATNLLIALVATLAARMVMLPSALKYDIAGNVVNHDWTGLANVVAGSFGAIFYVLLSMIVMWNVLLAFFNLLPIPPLDGSKILYSILPISTRTQMLLEQFGFVILLFVILTFGSAISRFIGFMLNVFFSMTL